MTRLIFLISLLTFIQLGLNAQTPSDALRFSTPTTFGTARTMAIGGAINALGGDYAVLSSNPAGLAIYRRSEFVISPNFSIVNTDATLDDNETQTEGRNRFNINNLGAVFFQKPRNEERKWKAFNLGIGYNKIADFSQRIDYDGNSEGSLVQSYQEQVNATNFSDFDPFGSELAINTGALFDDVNVPGVYFSDFDNSTGTPLRRYETVETEGNINEILFALGANYNNKLMMGLSVSFPNLSFNQTRDYNEEDAEGFDIPVFNRLKYEETIGTSGSGAQLKAGLIFRLNQQFRLGAAVHTPARFNLADTFSTSLIYNYTEIGGSPILEQADSPEGTFSYRFKTPWRYLGSAAYIIKTMGFVSAEIEYVNYGGANFDFDPENNSPLDAAASELVNEDIATTYQSAINIRLGAEYALEKLRFRLGCAINGSPFANDNTTNTVISTGFGIRLDRFFTDFAYRRSTNQEGFLPYSTEIAPQPFVSTNTKQNQLLLTLGFKF